MKINLTLCIFSLSFFFHIQAQVNWVKYPSNPVVVKQNFLTEFYAIGQPAVIMENDTFKMWYVACGLDHKGRVLYATSVNGSTWTKYGGGAVIMDVDSAGSWDDTWTDTPEIVHGPNGYLLYFFGDSITDVQPDPQAPTSSALGVATSPDGINWTRYSGNPILTKGDTGSWENFWIESPAVLWDSATSQYMMWYSGVNKNWLIQTGLATSPDGLNWTKYPGNPVITYGPPQSYDDMWVAVPSVIKKDGQFEMWYNAFNSIAAWDTTFICFATSTDGINWTKYAGNPLLNTFTPPSDTTVDKGGPWACDVVYDPNENNYKMWYETSAGFCYATSGVTTGNSFLSPFEKEDILVYPNPSGSFVNLLLPVSGSEMKIFNASGNVVFEKTLKSGHEVVTLDLPGGIYFLKVTMGNSVLTKKIIIQ
ncbi:MAG: T9SS type A sorting domain-containing protein [Bacteroidota bacterium]